MADTKIDWATKVWNPVTGCTKVSAGCKYCYAERLAGRFWGERKFTDIQCHPERLEEPLYWKKPARIFVDSMGDLFHKDVPDEFIREVFWTMQRCGWHTFIILTKRPERMNDWMNKVIATGGPILPNIWLGTSVEDQKTADERIPWLLKTPAAIRFVSVEPMLSKVMLYQDWLYPLGRGFDKKDHEFLELIKWVICGCESGPNARQMELDWARRLQGQCQRAGIPFFFKQAMIDGKLVKMPELDGRVWAEYPIS